MDKLVLEIELSDFNTNGLREDVQSYVDEFGDTFEQSLGLYFAETLHREEVSITVFSAPGEKSGSNGWDFHPMKGKILGYKLKR